MCEGVGVLVIREEGENRFTNYEFRGWSILWPENGYEHSLTKQRLPREQYNKDISE